MMLIANSNSIKSNRFFIQVLAVLRFSRLPAADPFCIPGACHLFYRLLKLIPMNRQIVLLSAFLMTGFIANAQLDKGIWLVGGSANFSSTNGETIYNGGIQKSTYLDISVSPDIGYFIADKFAVGIKPSFSYSKADYGELIDEGIPVAGGGYSHIMWFDIGPFIRYYFLPIGNRVNIFAEGNYLCGTANTKPAIYFTQHEFRILSKQRYYVYCFSSR